MNQSITSPQSFSYGRMIVETRLSGMAAMIACHCEPVFYNAQIPLLRLEMPDDISSLKATPAMASFEEALRNFLGANLEIEVVKGPAIGSPTAQSSAKKVSSLKATHEAIMNDELVQQMLKEFGGKILVETVRPAATVSAAAKPESPAGLRS